MTDEEWRETFWERLSQSEQCRLVDLYAMIGHLDTFKAEQFRESVTPKIKDGNKRGPSASAEPPMRTRAVSVGLW